MVMDLTETGPARPGALGCPRLGGSSQHRPLARLGPDRRPLGLLANRRRLALRELWEHYEYGRDPAYLGASTPPLRAPAGSSWTR